MFLSCNKLYHETFFKQRDAEGSAGILTIKEVTGGDKTKPLVITNPNPKQSIRCHLQYLANLCTGEKLNCKTMRCVSLAQFRMTNELDPRLDNEFIHQHFIEIIHQ